MQFLCKKSEDLIVITNRVKITEIQKPKQIVLEDLYYVLKIWNLNFEFVSNFDVRIYSLTKLLSITYNYTLYPLPYHQR